MEIPIGKLARTSANILRPTVGSADAYGQPTVTWATVARVGVSVAPRGSREFIRQSQVHAEMTHLVTLRYYPGLDTTYRLSIAGRTLEIASVEDVGERHRTMTLVCVEAV